ncbi:MAG: HAD family hydrolase [Eubacteriales bacterium]|nr:HAD family hydrolase [Eubacteriales bacterium]
MGKFSDILLTVDYDRTLTAPDATVPQRNLEAIRYFMAEGGAFTVNTGRSLPMAGTILESIPMNAPLLLYNGSAAYDTETGKMLFTHPIDLDVWQTVRTCMELVPDLMVEVQGISAHYRFAENPKWDAFYDFNRCPHAAPRPGEDLGPFLKFSVYQWEGSDNVGSLFQASPAVIRRLDQAQALLSQQFRDHCQVFRAGARILDIHARGVSKGRSARELQARLGRKILVCLGDAENDLPMLEAADYAFCPADGVLADRFENLCPCGQGAVADAIFEKIPGIL